MQVLKGRISQESDSVPTITLLENPLGAVITTSYNGLGNYTATSDLPIFNNDMPVRWSIANSQLCVYAISQVNATELSIQCYNSSGTESDNILSNNEFSIEI